MDVTEVINPQFAFPVFGVVLCAVLVFAFGFRSSVQPPSFDFEEEKKHKRVPKKPKKLQNGHIGNELNGTSSSPRQTKQSPSNKQPAEKSEQPKPKKKTPVNPKTTTKVAKETKPAPAKEQDAVSAGEWTTALSRKEKKMRGKKDERLDRYFDDGLSDEPQSDSTSASPKSRDRVPEQTPEVGPGGDNAEAKKPMDQRTAKKDRKKKNVESKTGDSAAVGKPVVTATSVAAAASAAVKEEKRQEAEAKPKSTPTKKQTKEGNVDSAKVESSPEKNSPKKKKKKATRLPEQVDSVVQPNAPDTSAPTEPSDVVGETTVPDAAAAIAEAMQESHDVESQDIESLQQQSDAAIASSVDAKPARSPKKKKKAKDKEKTQAVSDPHTEASQTQNVTESSVSSSESRVASTTPVSQPQPQTQGAAADRLNVPSAEEKSSATQAESSSSTLKPSTSSEDQSKVNFDELGDWQEAKPASKKKKKARREN